MGVQCTDHSMFIINVRKNELYVTFSVLQNNSKVKFFSPKNNTTVATRAGNKTE